MIRGCNFILWCLLAPFAFALQNDVHEKLHIHADTSFIDLKTGIYTYQGNVVSTQGSTVLTGDRITTKTDNQKRLLEIIATQKPGTLAHYHTIPNPLDADLDAKAERIYYYPQEHQVILMGQAMVTQGANVYTGPLLRYNTLTRTIITEQPHDKKDERSHFVLDANTLSTKEFHASR